MILTAWAEHDATGCAYRSDAVRCGAALQPGSSYCPEHHALCYLPRRSRAEQAELRHFAALAKRWVDPKARMPHCGHSPSSPRRLEATLNGTPT